MTMALARLLRLVVAVLLALVLTSGGGVAAKKEKKKDLYKVGNAHARTTSTLVAPPPI